MNDASRIAAAVAADPIRAYLDALRPVERTVIEHVIDLAREEAPEAVAGVSYSMPALLYRGSGLVAVVRRAKFLSYYPFSGKVIAAAASDLTGFECTSGAIHFSVASPLPDATVRRLVRLRLEEIDATRH
ncbi:iron chaperone [Curtobacterium ammoniigenes]|uniref:iron chaperone n=1 Tax=Curtobacterium ammoniigenes TaxID=395387 RepID=UPI0008343F10|nr:hypothetical protein [Curtobacterium ammoniigenes]